MENRSKKSKSASRSEGSLVPKPFHPDEHIDPERIIEDDTGVEDDTSEPRTEGFYLNDQGELCLGMSCLVMHETPEGLRFELNPDECDPETRERLVSAAIKGARLEFK